MTALVERTELVAGPEDAQVVARLVVEVDDALRTSLTLQAGEGQVELEADLHGARPVRVRSELLSSSTRVSRVVLDRFEVVLDPEREPRVPALR